MDCLPDPSSEPLEIPLPEADILYYEKFLAEKTATSVFQELMKETQWQQDNIRIFGKTYKQPRLTALYGTEGKTYSYSGILMVPKPFTHMLLQLKKQVEACCETSFTTVLLNLYRNGKDSNGWHSDDEKELGVNPTIASVSLGHERRFQLRNKKNKKIKYSLVLEHGSLLVMRGPTQHHWQHQIPKSKKIVDPRINLTFRRII